MATKPSGARSGYQTNSPGFIAAIAVMSGSVSASAGNSPASGQPPEHAGAEPQRRAAAEHGACAIGPLIHGVVLPRKT